MNAIFHGADLCTLKQQLQNLIIDLGQSISNPQRQILTQLYIALDTAETMLKELEQAQHIVANCLYHMTDQQILIASTRYQKHGLSSLWTFRSHPRQKLIERARRILGVGHVEP